MPKLSIWDILYGGMEKESEPYCRKASLLKTTFIYLGWKIYQPTGEYNARTRIKPDEDRRTNEYGE